MSDLDSLVRQMFEIIDGQRWDEYETVMHHDVRHVNPMATVASAAGWVQFSQGFAATFPDGRHTITRVIDGGDEGAIEGTWQGTHTAPLPTPQGTVPPTGRTVRMPFAGIGTVRDGRLSEVHVYFDVYGFMAQLGLVPEPASA